MEVSSVHRKRLNICHMWWIFRCYFSVGFHFFWNYIFSGFVFD